MSILNVCGAALAVALGGTPLPAREDFLTRPPIREVQLSPGGDAVAYLQLDGPDQSSAWVLDVASGARSKRVHTTRAERLAWSHDGNWVFLTTPKSVSGVRRDTGAAVVIAALEEKTAQRFAGVDPALPAHVLLTEQDRDRGLHRLVRVDVKGVRQVLYEGRRRVLDFLIDPDGTLAFLSLLDQGQQVISVRAEGGWKEVRRCGAVPFCRLLATSADRRTLLLDAALEGGFVRLVELNVGTGALRTLHADPERLADLRDVALHPLTGAPLIARYHTDRDHSYGLTPEVAADVQRIEQRFSRPGRSARIAVGGARWLVTESGSDLQWPRYHLYDPRTRTFTWILESAPPLTALPPKTFVTWKGSDGRTLHGFLTVPPGVDRAKVPLVVSVHGGPFSQTRNDYGAVVQFLVSRGHAVFEPNYRGSTGYGREYLEAAHGDFGDGRVQRDIVEGTRHVLAQGVGDPARVAIVGHSYGGYAALVGLTSSPELFKVGVASAPPTDFGWAIRWMVDHGYGEDDDQVPLRDQVRALELDVDDPRTMGRLTAQSPDRNAEKLQGPLLILAGAKDERVALKSVTHYAARLKALGKDVSLLVDPDSGHNLEALLAREAYFYLLERMLHASFGGPAPAPPSTALQTYLTRQLRLTGAAFGPPAVSGPP